MKNFTTLVNGFWQSSPSYMIAEVQATVLVSVKANTYINESLNTDKDYNFTTAPPQTPHSKKS